MKLPLTLHPANHLAVQCLLLHAAFSSDSVNGVTGDCARQTQYDMAASIARLHTRYDWEGQYGPRHIVRLSHCWRGVLHPPAAAATGHVDGSRAVQSTAVALTKGPSVYRVGASLSLVPPSSELNTARRQQQQQQQQQRLQVDAYRALAFTSPARLVALYAPPVLLCPLQRRAHDTVSYDAAVHHASLLTKLLAPYGVHVALTGATRRGCPFAFQAEYLLCLTEAATCEVEAVDPDGAGGVEKDDGADEHAMNNHGYSTSVIGASAVSTTVTTATDRPTREARCSEAWAERETKQQRRARPTILRDALMLRPQTLPSASSPAAADNVAEAEDGGATVVAGGGSGDHRQQHIHRRLGKQFRGRYCSRRAAFSSTDCVSPQVSYRVRRALEGLVRCGYVVSAAKSFPPSQLQLERRQPIYLTARYDPRLPMQVPPPACTDPAVLSRLQLHQLVLHVCPWSAFAVRQLFLTGPAAFTTHVTLQALTHGVDMNMAGVFLFGETGATSSDGGVSYTTPAHATAASEAHDDVLPPLHHEEQPRPCGDLVEQLILQDEAEVLSLAGLPHVDPMLRGLYCQRNHL
ncbi:hypothetical protein MNV84_00163 [Leishmania braziliensis]|nr:hypothetical protein MNV84_00163 [Leishmania braziliensis]